MSIYGALTKPAQAYGDISERELSDSTFDIRKNGLRGAAPSHIEMKGDLNAIQHVLDVVKAADRSSLAFMQSKSYHNGRDVVDYIDTSLEYLQSLEAITDRIKEELHQRRVRVVIAVETGSLNPPDLLPVMRLPTDMLYHIIEELALSRHATYRDLGWIQTSHVCSAWRRDITSFATLWAREVCAFRSPESFRIIALRAKDAALTVRNPFITCAFSTFGQRPRMPLHDLYFEVLPRVRTLDLALEYEDIARLIQALCTQILPVLETIRLENTVPLHSQSVDKDKVSIAVPGTLQCPNLRSLSLQRVFVICSSKNLASLSLSWDPSRPSPVTGTQLLDTLSELAENLDTLHLVSWLPGVWNAPTSRQVLLGRLRNMTLLTPPRHSDYLAFCKHIETPALASLCIENSCGPQSLPDTPEVLDWVLSNGPSCPCIQDSCGLAIHRLADQRLVVHMGPYELNPGRIGDLSRSLSSDSMRTLITRDPRPAVELLFMHVVYDIVDQQLVEPEFLFRSFVTRYASWRKRHDLRPIGSVSCKSRALLSMNVRDILCSLSDVETLYILLPPGADTEPKVAAEPDAGFLRAHTILQSDGTFYLPLLRKLLYKQDSRLFGFGNSASFKGGRIPLLEQIDALVEARAQHGTTLTAVPYKG